MDIGLMKQIGEGRYRFCFSLEGTNLCVKIPKENLVKKILGISFFFNMQAYLLLKFHVLSFNRKEYQIFQALNDSLGNYLPQEVQLENDLLFLERPRDYNGLYSKTIAENGPVKNPKFWEHIQVIEKIILERKLFLLDIFHWGNNLLVQKISQEEWKPILIDVKRLGYYTYPLQLNLLLKKQQQKKFQRRMSRFIKQFS